MTTIPELKDRCIEAAETFRKMKIRVGPGSKSGYWPEFQFERTKDYAPETTRVIVLPSSIEIQRAEEFAGWVNRFLSEPDRKAIHHWARLKTSPNRTIKGYCARIGMQEHNYRREIDEIFQKLLFNVYGISAALCSTSVDATEKTKEKQASSGRGADKKSGLEVWRPDEAQPQHLPESAQHKRLIADLLRRQKARQRTAA